MPRSGKRGNAKIGIAGPNIADLSDWTLNDLSELQAYASNATNERRARVAGIGDSNGTITYRPAGGAPPLVPGTTYTLELYEDSGDSPWVVIAMVGQNTVNVSADTGAIISYSTTFEENGGLTRPT